MSRDAITAIEAALQELIEARNALPEEFAAEIDLVIEQTKVLLSSLNSGEPVTQTEAPS